MAPKKAPPPLPDLPFKDEEVVRCSCGSAAFFDWGIKIITKQPDNSARSARMIDIAGSDNILICVSCRKPILKYIGDLYDASEYISKEKVAELMSHSRVPAAVMDP